MRPYLALLFYLGLVACSSTSGPTPVEEKGRALRHPDTLYRKVVAGDTLYSIAWENARDYRELARWNNIAAPYVIKPGQNLRLFAAEDSRRTEQGKASARNKARTYKVVRGDTLYSIARRYQFRSQALAGWNGISRPYTIRPGQILHLGPTGDLKPASKRAENNSSVSATNTKPVGSIQSGSVSLRPVKQWRWPTRGKLIARFRGINKGIDIAGSRGQPIKAAAAGKVVYTGSGLRGYGNLIIIKHNADFLSAYAHSDRTYVKEGDMIKQSQRIATMGKSGADRVKLHFEIRRRGNPVNPLKYLPRK
ncbi:MAG: peptidoglycan DD-metalloendopeptidase family protein [Gammaproteobacteria bacterium]|nr:MAG: peptidoglycan DD-metalloendopeptidase family protein [Gammaproteobacteria bacterium]